MKPTSTATKILHKAYRQRLIKTALGHGTRNKPPSPPAAGSSGVAAVKPSTPPVSTVGAFAGGAFEGGKNILGGIGNAAVGLKNMAQGAATATVGPTVRNLGDRAYSWWTGNKSINELNPQWAEQAQRAGEQEGYQMFTAGARDVAESFGQMVGLNNAWQGGQYVGAQAPQNAAPQHELRRQTYFSHPADRDLAWGDKGLQNVGDFAAELLPSAMTGRAFFDAAGKIPAVTRIGTAGKAMLARSPVLDKGLQTAGVATGMPLHPAVLPGGNLSGWAGASQFGQYAAQATFPHTRLSQFLPAPAVDEIVRNNLGENVPEHIDALAMAPSWRAGRSALAFPAVIQAAEPLVQNVAATQAATADTAERLAQLHAENAAPEQVNAVLDEYLQNVSQTTLPGQYEKIQQDVAQIREQLLNSPPEQKERMVAGIQNPDSEIGQELAAQGFEPFAQANADSAPQNPQDWGGWMNSLMAQFQAMDPMMQIGLGLGLGTGVLGLLSGLGGGGIGAFLLGALGLGAAGFMGAGAGMFGQDAQNFADDMKYNVGSMLGMVPKVNQEDIAPLLAADPLTELERQGPQIDYVRAATNPEEYAKTLAPQLQQSEARVGQLEHLAAQTPYMLTKVIPNLSLNGAQRLITNAKTVLADTKNPQGRLGARLARGRAFVNDPVAARNQELRNKMESVWQQLSNLW